MNRLIQQKEGLIGGSEEILELSKKKQARLILLSDSHGQTQPLRKIIETYGAKTDALVFAGDGICDLVHILNEAEKDTKLIQAIPPVIAFVRGNNDCFSYPVSFNTGSGKTSYGKYFTLKAHKNIFFNAAGKTIFLSHGHEEGVYYGTSALEAKAKLQNADAIIFGHTHVPIENRSEIYSVNPGSISFPRRANPCTFAIMEIRPAVIDTGFLKITAQGTFEGFSLQLY